MKEIQVPTVSKKSQILTLFRLGVGSVAELAWLTQSPTTYVSQILQEEGVLQGYFDLYTSSDQPMNVYSKYFTKRLGFKDEATAQRSVLYIDALYRQFSISEDRAGQHHAMMMALTMHNRAAWSGKNKEARIYGEWLADKLKEIEAIKLPEMQAK